MTQEESSSNQDVHIAGIVVYCTPERMESVKAQIALLPTADFHAQSAEGKVVVTLEAHSTKQILDYIDAIRALPDVLNVSLVYQHAEPAAALEEEVEP
jgi:nitrate reductase NapD